MGELTDLIFTILGKIGRLFNANGKRVCFIIWSIGLIYWMIRDFSLGLKVQAFGCIWSLIVHIYGWIVWTRKGIK